MLINIKRMLNVNQVNESIIALSLTEINRFIEQNLKFRKLEVARSRA